MFLICFIFNEVLEYLCVFFVFNYVYEWWFIEKYIVENGIDFINNQFFFEEQFIDIKVVYLIWFKFFLVISILVILKVLQDEWDVVMLYSFILCQQLQIIC